jgi:hypothetical protein
MITGLVSVLIYIAVLVLIAYLVIWVIGTLAPGHPAIIDNIIWVIVVLLCVLTLLQFVGGMPIPRLR